MTSEKQFFFPDTHGIAEQRTAREEKVRTRARAPASQLPRIFKYIPDFFSKDQTEAYETVCQLPYLVLQLSSARSTGSARVFWEYCGRNCDIFCDRVQFQGSDLTYSFICLVAYLFVLVHRWIWQILSQPIFWFSLTSTQCRRFVLYTMVLLRYCAGEHLWHIVINFGATVTSNGSPMLRGRCPVCLSVCLSVTLVHCGQTVGWIKMPIIGREIGLGPGDIVLDWDPPPSWKGAQQPPLFGPCLLWPNGRPYQLLLSSCFRRSNQMLVYNSFASSANF